MKIKVYGSCFSVKKFNYKNLVKIKFWFKSKKYITSQFIFIFMNGADGWDAVVTCGTSGTAVEIKVKKHFTVESVEEISRGFSNTWSPVLRLGRRTFGNTTAFRPIYRSSKKCPGEPTWRIYPLFNERGSEDSYHFHDSSTLIFVLH